MQSLDIPRRPVSAWLSVAVILASWVFFAGAFYFRVSAVENEIAKVHQEYARKDVLREQLQRLETKIDAIDQKMDQALRRTR